MPIKIIQHQDAALLTAYLASDKLNLIDQPIKKKPMQRLIKPSTHGQKMRPKLTSKHIQRTKGSRQAKRHATHHIGRSGVHDNDRLHQTISAIKASIAMYWHDDHAQHTKQSLTVRIHLAPDGTVLSVAPIRPSQDRLFNQQAIFAIEQASPLPIDVNPSDYDQLRYIILTMSIDQQGKQLR